MTQSLEPLKTESYFQKTGTPSYSEFIHLSRYSKWLEWLTGDKRRENWEETVERYIAFFVESYPHLESEIRETKDYILNFQTMPSMRALMTAGPALKKDAVAGYNCSYIVIDNPRAFDEIMYILMCGVGVGLSVERQYVTKLPEVAEDFHESDTVIVVRDSRIGWSSAFRELIGLLYAGQIPQWDTSRIRAKNSRLKTFGGRASGPEPLEELFRFTVALFRQAAGRKLSSIECHDLACKVADIVIVGGVRRCYPGDAKVLTPTGIRKMGEVKVGDEILSRGRKGIIRAKVNSGTQKLVKVTHRMGSTRLTPNHRLAVFVSPTQYEFRNASDLCPGDRVVWDNEGKTSIPSPSDVRSVENCGEEETWDLEIEDLHEFTADGLITHNSALLSLSNLSDDRMRKAKSGQWYVTDPQRRLANNSTAYTERPDLGVFLEEWSSLYDSKAGERGIFNRVAAIKQVEKNGRRDTNFEFGCNPCCVAADTLIKTSEGLRRIDELEGKPFTAVVDGKEYEAPRGSWKSGVGDIYRVTTKTGHSLELTKEHRLMRGDEWVKVEDLKPGDSLRLDSHGTATVSSIEFVRRDEVWDAEVSDIHAFDANGFYAHNSEILLRPNQFCNLSEIVVRGDDTLDQIKDKARVAAILGTLQATISKFRYLRTAWKRNTEEERLLGVSLTGIMDHPILNNASNPELPGILAEIKQVVLDTNKEWAGKLGISAAMATTCVKPSGTVSQLVNSASGIHARFAPFYVRRVRIDAGDPMASFMKEKGVPWEVDKMNASTMVFSFPIKSPEGAIFANEESAMDQLERWKIYQDHWCEHKPSCTVYYSDDEFLQVGAWVWKHFDNISGISFLPKSDHVYMQAPYEEISEEKYEQLRAELPKVNWRDLEEYETEDTTTSSHTLACSGGLCEVVDLVGAAE